MEGGYSVGEGIGRHWGVRITCVEGQERWSDGYASEWKSTTDRVRRYRVSRHNRDLG